MQEMKRLIVPTTDGSHTVSLPDAGITYHSAHGAMQESLHVFLRSGLDFAFQTFQAPVLFVFEMGFGTGLNAYLTALEAVQQQQKVHYTTVELFPLSDTEAAQLNYATAKEEQELFSSLHHAAWETDMAISPFFTLRKEKRGLSARALPRQFHLIYYDAFSPGHQPELWTQEVFELLYHSLLPGGILVTYCSKSDVRRAMQAAGFIVGKLPGPRGKREILRAVKPQH